MTVQAVLVTASFSHDVSFFVRRKTLHANFQRIEQRLLVETSCLYLTCILQLETSKNPQFPCKDGVLISQQHAVRVNGIFSQSAPENTFQWPTSTSMSVCSLTIIKKFHDTLLY